MSYYNIITLASLGIGIFILLLFTISSLKKGDGMPDLAKAISILLFTTAIAQGGYVCYISFRVDTIACIDISPTYLFLGGIAILWTSISKLYEILQRSE